MSRWRGVAVVGALGLLAAVCGAAVGGVAAADDPFVPLEQVAGKPLPEQVLFLPLAPEYQTCLPLSGPCPEGSAGLVVVQAEGRRVAWQPEGGDLTEVAVPTPPIPAVGSPPPEQERARYLVPVLDGGGTALAFAPRWLQDDRLVTLDGERPAEPTTAVAPSLAGPILAAGAPQGDGSAHVVEAPRVVRAAALEDAVPVLLVRRASPSRVVFGVRADNGWQVAEAAYVPLVGDDGVAHLARHDGRVGLAVAVPVAAEPGADEPGDEPADEPGGAPGVDDGGGADDDGSTAVVAAAAMAVALLVVGVGVMRRRRCQRAAPPDRRPVI